MKFIKPLKSIDLIVTILFIALFFYTYQITESYEYGLGQLIELVVRLPILFLLFVSAIISIIAVFNKKKVYLFSMLSQIFKIVAFLLNYVISRFILHVTFKLDHMILIPIYATIVLIIFMILRKIDSSDVID